MIRLINKLAVWIDFENAPHVWVMSSIIDHLRNGGHEVILTARDFSYTIDLCNRFGYQVKTVGPPGFGKNRFGKVSRVMERATRLFFKMAPARKRIAIALSHGSRSQIIAARLLGITVVSLDDYEYSNQSLIRFMDHLLVPFPISKSVWGRYSNKIVHYPGLKEELYLWKFTAAADGIERLKGITQVKILFRPEGRFTHYHSSFSQVLQEAILDYFSGNKEILVVMLPRDDIQGRILAAFCEKRNIPFWIPENVLDGPTLISEMDMVLSGGGTMTREAAVLGVPSYSFFAGEWGAVDRYLQNINRIIRIAEISDARRIKIERRDRASITVSRKGLDFINAFIDDAIAAHAS